MSNALHTLTKKGVLYCPTTRRARRFPAFATARQPCGVCGCALGARLVCPLPRIMPTRRATSPRPSPSHLARGIAPCVLPRVRACMQPRPLGEVKIISGAGWRRIYSIPTQNTTPMLGRSAPQPSRMPTHAPNATQTSPLYPPFRYPLRMWKSLTTFAACEG